MTKPLDLQGTLESHLESASFNVLTREEGFVLADKLGLMDDRETRLFWIPPPSTQLRDREFRQLEKRLLSDFERYSSEYPDASFHIIAHSRDGYSREFMDEQLKRYKVKFRVPVQFFDSPFRSEEAPRTPSAIQALRDSYVAKDRVPQPFATEGDGDGGEDLLATLYEDLRDSTSGPGIRIVVGSAGAGKSILFQALFCQLYDEFVDRKRRQELFPRPMPLIPEYFRGHSSLRTSELIQTFIRTDVAAPVTPQIFEWMLVNGFSTWLFDGLDELYAGDPEFFERLLDLLTAPGSRAQVVVCARDSLLASSENFHAFLREFPPGRGPVQVLHLKEWDRHSQRALSWIELENRPAPRGGDDTPAVRAFLDTLSRSSTLSDLAKVPYYCSLLLGEHAEGTLHEYSNDFELIQNAVDRISERERDKELLEFDNFLPGGFSEWLECVGAEYYDSEFTGISVDDVRDYAESVLQEGLTPAEISDTTTSLVQFPLFARGQHSGAVTFRHELIGEYLAAMHLFRRMQRSPNDAARWLRRRAGFSDSLLARYLAHRIGAEADLLTALGDTLRTAPLSEKPFASLLELYVLAAPSGTALKEAGMVFDGRDLRHVTFANVDLSDVSFRNANLGQVTFRECDLRNSMFEGAFLAGTRFEALGDAALQGARFGDLNRFETVQVGNRRYDDVVRFGEWVEKRTGVHRPVTAPCPAALQVKELFKKFVNLDGTPRRDELPLRALSRGTQHVGAPTPEKCVKAASRFGFLQGPDFRERHKRTPGETYSGMIDLVRDASLTPDTRRLLGALCDRKGCSHLPHKR